MSKLECRNCRTEFEPVDFERTCSAPCRDQMIMLAAQAHHQNAIVRVGGVPWDPDHDASPGVVHDQRIVLFRSGPGPDDVVFQAAYAYDLSREDDRPRFRAKLGPTNLTDAQRVVLRALETPEALRALVGDAADVLNDAESALPLLEAKGLSSKTIAALLGIRESAVAPVPPRIRDR
jgi:hypothetical protein